MVCGLLVGCASIAPDQATRERLVLERSNETLLQARAGRFIIRAQRQGQDDRGAQGRFEWLDYRATNDARRQILIWLGPLGQSAASLEHRVLPSGTIITAYDDQGLSLEHHDQLRFLSSVLGNDAAMLSDQDIYTTLRNIMTFFQESANSTARSQESEFRIGNTVVNLRIAMDAR